MTQVRASSKQGYIDQCIEFIETIRSKCENQTHFNSIDFGYGARFTTRFIVCVFSFRQTASLVSDDCPTADEGANDRVVRHEFCRAVLYQSEIQRSCTLAESSPELQYAFGFGTYSNVHGNVQV